MIKEAYKKTLLAILTEEFPDARIYLFGSQATGNVRVGSDIDIAIQEKKPINIKRIWKAQATIEETSIPYKVDLVDFTQAPKVLQASILKEGIPWKN